MNRVWEWLRERDQELENSDFGEKRAENRWGWLDPFVEKSSMQSDKETKVIRRRTLYCLPNFKGVDTSFLWQLPLHSFQPSSLGAASTIGLTLGAISDSFT